MCRCNNFSCRKVVCVCGLFPYGKSGLKCPVGLTLMGSACLFPYGKSGLKFFVFGHLKRPFLSLPVWEEWIEICCPVQTPPPPGSLPVWEEWIEMLMGRRFLNRISGLFPYGKSGLKFAARVGVDVGAGSLPVWEEWIEILYSSARAEMAVVSSRMGRVD